MLEAMDRENFSTSVPSRVYRKSSQPSESTLAMHWDGTYRDRIGDSGPRAFWTEEDYDVSHPSEAHVFANHLASNPS